MYSKGLRLSHPVLSSHLQQQKEEEDGWQGLATAHQGSGPRVSGLHGPAGLWAETGRNHHAQEAGHSRSAEEACQGMFTLPVLRLSVRLSTVPRQRRAWTLLKQTVPCHNEHLNATRTIPHRQWYATCRTLGLVGCKSVPKEYYGGPVWFSFHKSAWITKVRTVFFIRFKSDLKKPY